MCALRRCPRQQIQPQESFLSACSRSQGGCKHKQLLALTEAPFPLSVFGPRCSKARKIGAVCFSRLLHRTAGHSQHWLLAYSPSMAFGQCLRQAAGSPSCSGAPGLLRLGCTDSSPPFQTPNPLQKLPDSHDLVLPFPPQMPRSQKKQNTPGAGAAMPGMLQRAASQKHELLQQHTG